MIRKLGLSALLCAAFFVGLEGISSILVVTYHALFPEGGARTLSSPAMRYDSQLGWVSVPNFYAKNYYAPGISLKINSRGFRANQEFPEQVPAGKLRVLYSGDSQTFGDGVGEDRAWCQLLESMDKRLETVNMAQTGYGIDQMYLWYKRAGEGLAHDVHVLAFVTDDFRRMQLDRLVGYAKPVLKVRNGTLAVEHVPVPGPSRLRQWLALKPHPLREFRSAALLWDSVSWLESKAQPAPAGGPGREQQEVLDKIIENLQNTNRERNSVFVMVFLPRDSDYGAGDPSRPWRTFIRSESLKRNFAFIDLYDDFERLPVTMREGMFIWPGSQQYFAETPGHYGDQGNEFVARLVYPRLAAIPEIAEKLAVKDSGSRPAKQVSRTFPKLAALRVNQ
jgi:hypothetical protein